MGGIETQHRRPGVEGEVALAPVAPDPGEQVPRAGHFREARGALLRHGERRVQLAAPPQGFGEREEDQARGVAGELGGEGLDVVGGHIAPLS